MIFLQPLIEYGTLEYDCDELTIPCQSIWYGCKILDSLMYIPDCSQEIIFKCKDEQVLMNRVEKKKLTQVNVDTDWIFGIRIEPGYFFDLNDDIIMSTCNELSGIDNESDRRRYLQAAIIPYIHKLNTHPSVKYMLESMVDSAGKITVEELASQLGYTTRHINKLFTDSIGLGPKNFGQFIRLQNALYEMISDPYRNNSEFIENLSYSDQAHFQREFKRYTGMTPKKFISSYII